MENTQGARAPQGVATSSNRWIADVRKNAREIVRVERATYQGHELINLRVWAVGAAGEYIPTKGGFSLRVAKLPELAAAIAKAIDATKAEGFL